MAINKVVYGSETLIDLTSDTATAADVAQGKTFHLANGVQATGTASGGGSASPWTHLAHAEFDVSTTSTSFISVGTVDAGYESFNAARFLYIRVRDKAGARTGYYAGGDTLIANILATAYSNASVRFAPNYLSYTGSNWYVNAALASSSYGIVPYSLSKVNNASRTDGVSINMRARYSSNTRTIDGTYTVDVFALSTPEGFQTAMASALDGALVVNNIAASGNFATVDKTTAAAGETVTVTAGMSSYLSTTDILANIGEGGKYVAILSTPATGDTAVFSMPDRSVNIIAVTHE